MMEEGSDDKLLDASIFRRLSCRLRSPKNSGRRADEHVAASERGAAGGNGFAFPKRRIVGRKREKPTEGGDGSWRMSDGTGGTEGEKVLVLGISISEQEAAGVVRGES